MLYRFRLVRRVVPADDDPRRAGGEGGSVGAAWVFGASGWAWNWRVLATREAARSRRRLSSSAEGSPVFVKNPIVQQGGEFSV